MEAAAPRRIFYLPSVLVVVVTYFSRLLIPVYCSSFFFRRKDCGTARQWKRHLRVFIGLLRCCCSAHIPFASFVLERGRRCVGFLSSEQHRLELRDGTIGRASHLPAAGRGLVQILRHARGLSVIKLRLPSGVTRSEDACAFL